MIKEKKVSFFFKIYIFINSFNFEKHIFFKYIEEKKNKNDKLWDLHARCQNKTEINTSERLL